MDATKAIVNFIVASEGRHRVEAKGMCWVLVCFSFLGINRVV